MIPLFVTLYRFGKSIRIAIKDPAFEGLMTLLIILVGSGTIFYHDIEGWRWLDSLYFSVVTLTTVGYGDLSPHTDIGKIFTMVYLLVGIGVLLGFVNLITQRTVEDTIESPIIPHNFWPLRTPKETAKETISTQ